MFGDYGAQQTMGDLYIKIDQSDEISDYRRELDLQHAVGSVEYMAGKVRHSRTYFGSYPQRTMVYRFENTASGGRSYRIRFKTPHVTDYERFENGQYLFRGHVADNGMEFGLRLGIKTEEGTITYNDGEIVVSNANSVTILHAAATNYQNKFPDYTGRDYRALINKIAAFWDEKSWQEMLSEHQEDYQSLFDRVSFDLAGETHSETATDERLQAYYQGENDHGLEELYFQYGRYLMISGSRPGTLPLNLQGKWNNSTNPPWANDYHMNINQQMLYWPAEVTNLQESHLPLFDYMEGLVPPGQKAAAEFFDARGWVVNTMNNAFGYTSPGWGFPWGFFPGGAAWLSRHLWEHYAFTQDKEFLKETAYPIMKKAALFWMDYLIKDENGYLVSSPSYSPEHGGISEGASMDHQIAWDILNNTARAAEILNIDHQFRQKALKTRDQIYPPQIGRWGQLQEWKEDVDDPDNHHRHVSHLYALYPGNQISKAETPKLAEAAQTSLEARGDGGTGWSLAWKISFWARLKDGDHAYRLLQRLLRPVNSKEIEMQNGGGSYSNLLCAHPPFQLDGNMGATAGIAEMLLQSHTDAVELLPALPQAWPEGSLEGLRARGGLTIDIAWSDGRLDEARIKADKKGSYEIRYQNKTLDLEIDSRGTRVVRERSFN